MSSLNSFSIEKIGADFADIRVRIVHPDEHIIQTSPNFALQILLEHFEQIREGYIYNSGWSFYPFTQEEGNTFIENEYLPLLDELVEKMRWRNIPISKEEHDAISESGNFEYQGQKLSSIGMENGQYYASLETEHDEFCRAADKCIRKVELISVKNYPHWFDRLESWLQYEKISYGFDEEVYDQHQDEPDPEYLLRIHLEKDSLFLLNHLRVQSQWESAAYNFEYYCKVYRTEKEADFNCLQYDTIPVNADDKTLETWWNELSDEWKTVFNVNLFLQRRLYYPSLHEQFKGMMTLGVFEQQYGKETLETLRSKTPSINELRNIVSMKMLFASNCGLKDLSPLSMLKNLKLLELEANPIKNADALAELTELEDLTMIIYENKPDQLALSNLTKIKDLTFDPSNQAEFDCINNMPELRTFYTLMEFEADLSALNSRQKLNKIVGYSPTLNSENRAILEALRSRSVEVGWETESEEF